MLLHETGQHEEAIGTLEEAVERYPQDPQRLRRPVCNRRIVSPLGQRGARARCSRSRTASERDKAQQLATERLEHGAYKHFEEVQRQHHASRRTTSTAIR